MAAKTNRTTTRGVEPLKPGARVEVFLKFKKPLKEIKRGCETWTFGVEATGVVENAASKSLDVVLKPRRPFPADYAGPWRLKVEGGNVPCYLRVRSLKRVRGELVIAGGPHTGDAEKSGGFIMRPARRAAVVDVGEVL